MSHEHKPQSGPEDDHRSAGRRFDDLLNKMIDEGTYDPTQPFVFRDGDGNKLAELQPAPWLVEHVQRRYAQRAAGEPEDRTLIRFPQPETP